MTGYVLGDRGLTHGDPEFSQLAVNARRTPQRVRLRHRMDQRADVRRHGRPAYASSALPRPEQAEAKPVPVDNRLRLHNDQRCPPSTPEVRQHDPEQTVGRGKTHTAPLRPFQHKQLVPQREYLKMESRTRANQRTHRTEYRYDDRHHDRRLCDLNTNLNKPAPSGFLVGTGCRARLISSVNKKI
jgi:hypothetical protein